MDAAQVLLKSQGRPGRGFCVPGHARGHAMVSISNMDFIGKEECVQQYSENERKTAFIERSQQDSCLHYCLTTVEARIAMGETKCRFSKRDCETGHQPLGFRYGDFRQWNLRPMDPSTASCAGYKTPGV